MVSSSTPNATAKPISAEDQRQRAEHRERAGQHAARRGDHAAGGGQPDQRAAAGAVPLRLLAHPGHQEDVVVDAQRDQEHEDEQRERRVRAAEAEHVVEDQRADARARPRTTAPRSRSAAAARRSARSSSTRMRSTTTSTIGMIRFRSCVGGALHVQVDRGAAADHASAPGTACTAARTRSTVSYAAWLSGGVGQRALEVARGRPRSTGWRHAGDAAACRRTPSAPAPAAPALPITIDRLPAPPAGKCRASTSSPTTESGWPRNDSAFGQAVGVRAAISPSASDAEHQRR